MSRGTTKRPVRVEDDLWHPAAQAAQAEGTTRAEVMRQALVDLVARHPQTDPTNPTTSTNQEKTDVR